MKKLSKKLDFHIPLPGWEGIIIEQLPVFSFSKSQYPFESKTLNFHLKSEHLNWNQCWVRYSTTSTLNTNIVYKWSKCLYLKFCYFLKFTYFDNIFKTYEFNVLSQYNRCKPVLFKCEIKEIKLVFYIFIKKNNKFEVSEMKKLISKMKNEKLKNIKLEPKQKLIFKAYPLFLKHVLFPLMIEYIKKFLRKPEISSE